MTLLYRFMTVGAAACALTLLGFPGQADVTTRLMLKASPALTILAADEENSEVENLLDPEADNGVPGGPTEATPGDGPRPASSLLAAAPSPKG
jgi:hypothetical protein